MNTHTNHSAGLMLPARAKIHLKWIKPVIPFSKVNYSTDHRFTDTVNLPSQLSGSLLSPKTTFTDNELVKIHHAHTSRSIVLSHRKTKIDRAISTYITNKNSSNILHFTRLAGRFDTTLGLEVSRTYYLKVDRKSQIDKLSNPQHSK